MWFHLLTHSLVGPCLCPDRRSHLLVLGAWVTLSPPEPAGKGTVAFLYLSELCGCLLCSEFSMNTTEREV